MNIQSALSMLAAVTVVVIITITLLLLLIFRATKRAPMAIKASPVLISNHGMGQDSNSFLDYVLQSLTHE